MRVIKSFYVEEELYKYYESISREKRISISWIINKLLEDNKTKVKDLLK